MAEFPSAHDIGDHIEIGPTADGSGPPMAWPGVVQGVHFLKGKVRYDVVDRDGFTWQMVDSCLVRLPGIPNPAVRVEDLVAHLDSLDDPENVVRLPLPRE